MLVVEFLCVGVGHGLFAGLGEDFLRGHAEEQLLFKCGHGLFESVAVLQALLAAASGECLEVDEVLDQLALAFGRRVDHAALRIERAQGLIKIGLRDLVVPDGGQHFGLGGQGACGKSKRGGQRCGRKTVQFRHDG